jgi:glycine betaine/choline ABC-type transport system substrate-binding protein
MFWKPAMTADLPDFDRSRAVLIGSASYRDAAFLPLPAAANSLEGLREILLDAQLCCWPAGRVIARQNPTDSRRLVADLRRWARATEDVLLVYYVGHGTISPEGELCLALSDTEFNDPDITGIEYRHVRSALMDSPARIKVVILDCCYSGRAIQALSGPGDIADITDIRGAYTITASDYAAHVPPLPQQTQACTSFTGELLDLIRHGIPGGPDTLTLSMIYSHLRARLHSCRLPAPNQRGTDTAGEFGFTRNAALLNQPIERFPRPEARPARRAWPRLIIAAAAAAALAATGGFLIERPSTPSARLIGSGCSTPIASSEGVAARGDVVIGSQDFPESRVLAQIYADALAAKGIDVTTQFNFSSREVYYPELCSGEITIVPEYNGALLTTSVDQKIGALTTGQVDTALEADLPASLETLDPAPAQDKDSVTVTQATAAKYHLVSLADLRRVAPSMVMGGPSEFPGREEGLLGLKARYGVRFKSFEFLDDSGPETIEALVSGQVQAADIFTTNPAIKLDHLVVLSDPRHVFAAENIVPLVYKAGVNATVIRTLNAVSARLTMAALLDLNVSLTHESVATTAQDWLRQAGLT